MYHASIAVRARREFRAPPFCAPRVARDASRGPLRAAPRFD